MKTLAAAIAKNSYQLFVALLVAAEVVAILVVLIAGCL